MKYIILFFIILKSSFLFSQSKVDSEEWIVNKYNEYERATNSEFDLNFEDGYLDYTYLNTIFRVKVKDITKIEIRQERFNSSDKEGWTSMFVYFKKGKLETKKIGDSNFEQDYNDSFFKILFNSDFLKDGNKNRMQKAITHLVKLYGGNATVKKEAF